MIISSSLDLDHVSHNSAYGSHERNLKSHLPPSISHEIFFHSSLLLYPFFLSFLFYLYPFIHSFILSFFLFLSYFIYIHSFILTCCIYVLYSLRQKKEKHHITSYNTLVTVPNLSTYCYSHFSRCVFSQRQLGSLSSFHRRQGLSASSSSPSESPPFTILITYLIWIIRHRGFYSGSLDPLRRYYCWPGHVKRFIRNCDPSQSSNAPHDQDNGLLVPFPIPTQRWQDIPSQACTLICRLPQERHHVLCARPVTKLPRLHPASVTTQVKKIKVQMTSR